MPKGGRLDWRPARSTSGPRPYLYPPDRLVVGEVRGAEVVELLAALNTGHEGGCGTVHANAAAHVPARLEALGVAAGLARLALHSQLSAAVDAVVHLARGADGVRRVSELAVLLRDDTGLVVVQPALTVHGPQLGYDRLQELLGRYPAGEAVPLRHPGRELWP